MSKVYLDAEKLLQLKRRYTHEKKKIETLPHHIETIMQVLWTKKCFRIISYFTRQRKKWQNPYWTELFDLKRKHVEKKAWWMLQMGSQVIKVEANVSLNHVLITKLKMTKHLLYHIWLYPFLLHIRTLTWFRAKQLTTVWLVRPLYRQHQILDYLLSLLASHHYKTKRTLTWKANRNC